MKCHDAETCKRVSRQVTHAISFGELLEDQLAGGFSRPVRAGTPTGRTPPPEEWLSRRLATVKRRFAGNRQPTVSISQSLKMARYSEDFHTALGGLPSEVDIDQVGKFSVVSEESRSRSGSWAERCRERVDVRQIYNEVKFSLADLATAKTRLDLGEMRLGAPK